MFNIRFWNKSGECMEVGGKYSHEFDTETEAWDGANALVKWAYEHGAVEMDMNNVWYDILWEVDDE